MFTIWVPSEDVIDDPDDRQSQQDVQWITQPPGDLMGIHLVVIDSDHGEVEANLVPVNGFMLANGQMRADLAAQDRVRAAFEELATCL